MQNEFQQQGDRPIRVGYILKMFPRLSETFILNELLELERQGADASVFSLMYPNDGRFHGRLADLQLTAEYFPGDKPDRNWSKTPNIPANEFIPTVERWNEAADFVRRHSIPKGFGLLVRASLIAARVRDLEIDHLHAHFATVSTRVAALVGIMTCSPSTGPRSTIAAIAMTASGGGSNPTPRPDIITRLPSVYREYQ